MNCKICKGNTDLLFTGKILHKYDASYLKCQKCGFIQTSPVFWLNEAYKNAISDLDVGYVARNIIMSEFTASVIKTMFNKKKFFLDYGGGYGLFVRLMRDKGVNFYRQDMFCENYFAKHFDITNSPSAQGKNKFELLTAFEVFEHLDSPLEEIDQMFSFSDSLLFSTELIPSAPKINNPKDWWYFAPETGQHISFYSLQSLSYIAEKFNCYLYSNNSNLHLLTKTKYSFNYIKIISKIHNHINHVFSRHFYNKKSLISSDFEYIKSQSGSGRK